MKLPNVFTNCVQFVIKVAVAGFFTNFIFQLMDRAGGLDRLDASATGADEIVAVAAWNEQREISGALMKAQPPHVYAPGTKYRAVTVTLNGTAWLKQGKTVYPKPSIYFFRPFKEQVLVFSEKFTLTTPIAIGTIPARLKQVKITGALSYQACDDRVCYLPQSVPLEWVVAVRR